jgi:hypothetical protein
MYHPHYYSLRGSEVDDENGKDEIYLSDYSLLYRIITQIYLLLSIQVLILVLAAPGPVVVRGIHEARNDDLEMGPAENVATMPNEPGEVEAASDRPASPPPSPNAMVSLEHLPSLDGSTSSGYPTPHLSESSSVSGLSWMFERPPRLSPSRPVSPYASASDGSLSSQHFSESDGPESFGISMPESSPYSYPEYARLVSIPKGKIIASLAVLGVIIGGGVFGFSKLHEVVNHKDS